MQPERKLMLRALGAELVLTDPLEGAPTAPSARRGVYAEDPDKYFYPINTTTTRTGARITTRRDRRSSNKRADG
jgi:cysteine synthase